MGLCRCIRTDMGGYHHITVQIIALFLHVEQLGCHRQGNQRPVSVGHEADPFRPGPQTSEPAENSHCGGRFSCRLPIDSGNPDPNHIRLSAVSFQLIDGDIGFFINTEKIILHRRSAGRAAVQSVV